MDTQYELTERDDLKRPWAIVPTNGDAPTFTFAKRDEGFAREILDNLNAGRAWEPSLAESIEMLEESIEELEAVSLEDTDKLAEAS